MLRVMIRCFCLVLLPLTMVGWPNTSYAKSIKIKPSSHHSTLTLSTSGEKGFMILPKRPMELKVVGPGTLKMTVRLNSTKKRREFKGTLQIKANKKRLHTSRLNLFMSRVASYRKNRSLHPSTPKKLTVDIPGGLQNIRISLKANRHTSMTISLIYDSSSDQSAAEDDDQLALVPLVPPKKEQKTQDDTELAELVPLVPVKPRKKTVQSKHKKTAAIKPAPKPKTMAMKKDSKKNKTIDKLASEEFELYKGQPKPKPHSKTDTKPAVLDKPKRVAKITRSVETKTNQDKASVSTSHPPVKSKPFFSLGLYAGEISPFQAIGSSSFTGSLDLRYILPVFDGRLGLGLGVSYHRFTASIGYENSATKTSVKMDAIPISLQLFYRIPLDTVIEPFVGAGADLVIGLAEVGYENTGSTVSDTAVGFGGHLSIGAEASMGPGFFTIEVRGAVGIMNLEVIRNLNPSGLSILAGYRLEI